MRTFRQTRSFRDGLMLALLLSASSLYPVLALAAVYAPGETLNPACAPTDSNCTVETAFSSSTAVTISGSGSVSGLFLGALNGMLRAVNGRVQSMDGLVYESGRLSIGSTSPAAMLDITNNATSSPALIMRDQLGFIGLELRTGTSSLRNIFLGTGVGAVNETGASSTAVGYHSLYSNTTGNQNTAFGVRSLFANTTGSNNTAIGYLALAANTIGENNTAVGWRALSFNESGSDNTAVGEYALFSNSDGSENVAVGEASMYSNTSGSYNTAFGFSTLYANLDGIENTAVGYKALYSNTEGSNNIAFGNRAMFSNTTGDENIGMGLDAMYSNLSGTENTAIGFGTLFANDVGSYNTALGWRALYLNTSGENNTGLGLGALYANVTGSNNTAVGFESLRSNVGGANTVALGYTSLYNNTTAAGVVALGSSAAAGDSEYANQGGTYVGFESGYSADTGSDYNTFLGYQAGYNVTTGSNNILIGAVATTEVANLTTGSQNILIGSNIAFPSPTDNGQLNIGNLIFGTGLTGIGTTVSPGSIGIGTSIPDEGRIEVKGDTICVDTDGDDSASSCLASESDGRLKENAQTLGGALDTIDQLRGVSFDWRVNDPAVVAAHPLIKRFSARPRDVGVIAQEVASIWPVAIETETIDGFFQVDYRKFVPLLIEGVKEQRARGVAFEQDVFGATSTPASRAVAPTEHDVYLFQHSWLGNLVRAFLASGANGLETMSAGTLKTRQVEAERLCVGSTCVTEAEFAALLAASAVPVSAPVAPPPDDAVEADPAPVDPIAVDPSLEEIWQEEPLIAASSSVSDI